MLDWARRVITGAERSNPAHSKHQTVFPFRGRTKRRVCLKISRWQRIVRSFHLAVLQPVLPSLAFFRISPILRERSRKLLFGLNARRGLVTTVNGKNCGISRSKIVLLKQRHQYQWNHCDSINDDTHDLTFAWHESLLSMHYATLCVSLSSSHSFVHVQCSE